MGERSVIAYARTHADYVAGLDDRSARLFCEQLGINVVGMVGILLTAKRKGLFPSLRPLLESAHAQGFRMSKELYQEALSLAGEKT
jgi:predicted nucleic acid-binding protein